MPDIIIISKQKSKRGSRRSKKLSTKIDLTPMVDLGFLLITFFIVSTTLAKPRTMPLRMPANGDSTALSRKVVLTLIACHGDRVFYYHGEFADAVRKINYGITNYSQTNGIREIIAEKQAELDISYRGGRKELMVLIKAAREASYENVVKLLDEMAIDEVRKYSMVELNDGEIRILYQEKLIN